MMIYWQVSSLTTTFSLLTALSHAQSQLECDMYIASIGTDAASVKASSIYGPGSSSWAMFCGEKYEPQEFVASEESCQYYLGMLNLYPERFSKEKEDMFCASESND